MSYKTVDGWNVDQALLRPEVATRMKIEDRHPGAIVFFEQEDFYVVYGDNAKIVSKQFGIGMRSVGATKLDTDLIHECCVPGHMVNKYAAELGLMGYPTALCQVVTIGNKHHCYVRSRFVTD